MNEIFTLQRRAASVTQNALSDERFAPCALNFLELAERRCKRLQNNIVAAYMRRRINSICETYR